ncbi:hypothetical protein CLAIMM_14711 [Cladophialophora immunda]|nr:hypothetical protein CLAIMM_14711 [Cladophialophora immunda]
MWRDAVTQGTAFGRNSMQLAVAIIKTATHEGDPVLVATPGNVETRQAKMESFREVVANQVLVKPGDEDAETTEDASVNDTDGHRLRRMLRFKSSRGVATPTPTKINSDEHAHTQVHGSHL